MTRAVLECTPSRSPTRIERREHFAGDTAGFFQDGVDIIFGEIPIKPAGQRLHEAGGMLEAECDIGDGRLIGHVGSRLEWDARRPAYKGRLSSKMKRRVRCHRTKEVARGQRSGYARHGGHDRRNAIIAVIELAGRNSCQPIWSLPKDV